MPAVRYLDALAASIVLLAACSSFESSPSGAPDADAPASGPDASAVDDGAPPGVAEAGVRCERDAPFTSIRPIDGVNSPDNEGIPRVSADERVIYFQRAIGTELAIFRASRAGARDAFDTPIRVEGLPSDARHPFVMPGELEIVFVQRVGEAQRSALRRARRATITDPFGEAAPHPAEDPSVGRQTPFISATGLELFVTQTVSPTNSDLYRATLAADGGVGTPEPLVTLNTTTLDSDAVLSPDLLSLYFYSERSAPRASEGSIWVAHRDTPTGPFRAPARVEELVFDGKFTSPGSASEDGCRLYFYSNKDAATTGYDLYVAERSPR